MAGDGVKDLFESTPWQGSDASSAEGSEGGLAVTSAGGLEQASGVANAEIIEPDPGRIDSIVQAIANNPDLDESIAFNVAEGALYVRGKVPWGGKAETRRWNDVDQAHIKAWLQTACGLGGSDSDVRDALTKHAYDSNRFDPMVDMLDSLPEWDGVGRIGRMMHLYLGAPGDAYTTEVESLLYDALVRRISDPGCKYDCVVVLEGPQGIGKSTFARLLAIRDELFTDYVGDINSKEAAERIQGKAVVELSELNGLQGKESEAVKSFVSRAQDNYRKPYARFAESLPRRCVFVGTTNSGEYLTDRTGNRRFLPIKCAEGEPERDIFDDDATTIDFPQALAEAYARYKSGAAREKLVLDENVSEAAEAARKGATTEDPWAGQIEEFLSEREGMCVCTQQVAKEALGVDDPTGGDLGRIRELLVEFGWKKQSKKKRISGYGSMYVYQKTAER